MSILVKEVDELLEKLLLVEAMKKAKEEELKSINKEYGQLLFRAQAFLVELNRSEYTSPLGKVEIKEEWRVRLPENDIEKNKLFDHLRERGIFDKYATVNSNSLNALFRADWEEAKARGEGMTFSMPGVPAPVMDRVPKFKASKK